MSADLSYSVHVDWDLDGFSAGDEVTADVREVQCIGAGLPDHLSQVAAVGICLITVNNDDGRWNPNNPASPYFGKPLLNRPVRVDVTDGVAAWTVFSGYIRRVSVSAREVGDHAAVLYCEDAIGLLQAHRLSLPLQEGKRGDELLRLIAASAFDGGAATGRLYFYGNANNGETVTIGGRTYTFVSTLTGANQVKIEPYRHETARNLAAAINGDAGAGTYYGAGTVRHALVSADDHSHSFEAAGFTGELPVGRISGMWLKQAQSFTPRVDSHVTRIRFTLGNSFGSPTSTITWSIQTDNAGLPSGTVVQSGIVAPTPNTQHTVNVTGALLTGGQTYWLVLELTSDQPNNTGYYVRSHNPSIFTGGTHAQYNDATGGWQTYDYDLNFEVSLGGIVTFTALARGSWGNSIGLAENGSGMTVSGASLTRGTDGTVPLAFDVSTVVHDLAGDQWGEERTSALDAVEDVIGSEGTSFFWASRSGSLVYHTKDWWFKLPTVAPALSVDGAMIDLPNALDVADVHNEVTVTYRPRRFKSPGVIARATGVLEIPVTTRDPRWATTQNLPDGGKYVVRLPFIDPDTGRTVGATNIINPVPGIDFQVWESIGGRNYTDKGWVSVSTAVTGSGVECTFINHGGTPFYVTDFQVRGTAIIDYDAQQAIRQDPTSVETYGKRGRAVDLPLYVSQAHSEALAEYLLYQYKDARLRVREVVWGGQTHVAGKCLYSFDFGSLIALSNAELNLVDSPHLIVGHRFVLRPGGDFSLIWLVRAISELTYLVLDNTTFGRLDLNRLGL